jgi:hypothetical protein
LHPFSRFKYPDILFFLAISILFMICHPENNLYGSSVYT